MKEYRPLVHLRYTVLPCLLGHGVWLCRRSDTLSGLLPPDLATPRSDCPQLLPTATAARGWVSQPTRIHSASWRTIESIEQMLRVGDAGSTAADAGSPRHP